MRQLRTLFPGIKRPGGVVIGTWKDTDKQNVVLFPLFSALQPEPSVEFRRWVDSTERVSRRCAGDARYLYRIPPHASSCDAMCLVLSTSSAPDAHGVFYPVASDELTLKSVKPFATPDGAHYFHYDLGVRRGEASALHD